MTTLQVQPEKPTLRLNLYLIPNLFPLPKPYNLTFTASNPNLPSTFYPKPLYYYGCRAEGEAPDVTRGGGSSRPITTREGGVVSKRRGVGFEKVRAGGG